MILEARGLILEARGLILEARELILEARRAILKISGIIVIFGELPARKTRPILRQIWTNFYFLAVLFYDVFSSACFFDFLWFWVPGGSILVSFFALFWESRTFGKTFKTV